MQLMSQLSGENVRHRIKHNRNANKKSNRKDEDDDDNFRDSLANGQVNFEGADNSLINDEDDQSEDNLVPSFQQQIFHRALGMGHHSSRKQVSEIRGNVFDGNGEDEDKGKDEETENEEELNDEINEVNSKPIRSNELPVATQRKLPRKRTQKNPFRQTSVGAHETDELNVDHYYPPSLMRRQKEFNAGQNDPNLASLTNADEDDDDNELSSAKDEVRLRPNEEPTKQSDTSNSASEQTDSPNKIQMTPKIVRETILDHKRPVDSLKSISSYETNLSLRSKENETDASPLHDQHHTRPTVLDHHLRLHHTDERHHLAQQQQDLKSVVIHRDHLSTVLYSAFCSSFVFLVFLLFWLYLTNWRRRRLRDRLRKQLRRQSSSVHENSNRCNGAFDAPEVVGGDEMIEFGYFSESAASKLNSAAHTMVLNDRGQRQSCDTDLESKSTRRQILDSMGGHLSYEKFKRRLKANSIVIAANNKMASSRPRVRLAKARLRKFIDDEALELSQRQRRRASLESSTPKSRSRKLGSHFAYLVDVVARATATTLNGSRADEIPDFKLPKSDLKADQANELDVVVVDPNEKDDRSEEQIVCAEVHRTSLTPKVDASVVIGEEIVEAADEIEAQKEHYFVESPQNSSAFSNGETGSHLFNGVTCAPFIGLGGGAGSNPFIGDHSLTAHTSRSAPPVCSCSFAINGPSRLSADWIESQSGATQASCHHHQRESKSQGQTPSPLSLMMRPASVHGQCSSVCCMGTGSQAASNHPVQASVAMTLATPTTAASTTAATTTSTPLPMNVEHNDARNWISNEKQRRRYENYYDDEKADDAYGRAILAHHLLAASSAAAAYAPASAAAASTKAYLACSHANPTDSLAAHHSAHHLHHHHDHHHHDPHHRAAAQLQQPPMQPQPFNRCAECTAAAYSACNEQPPLHHRSLQTGLGFGRGTLCPASLVGGVATPACSTSGASLGGRDSGFSSGGCSKLGGTRMDAPAPEEAQAGAFCATCQQLQVSDQPSQIGDAICEPQPLPQAQVRPPDPKDGSSSSSASLASVSPQAKSQVCQPVAESSSVRYLARASAMRRLSSASQPNRCHGGRFATAAGPFSSSTEPRRTSIAGEHPAPLELASIEQCDPLDPFKCSGTTSAGLSTQRSSLCAGSGAASTTGSSSGIGFSGASSSQCMGTPIASSFHAHYTSTDAWKPTGPSLITASPAAPIVSMASGGALMMNLMINNLKQLPTTTSGAMPQPAQHQPLASGNNSGRKYSLPVHLESHTSDRKSPNRSSRPLFAGQSVSISSRAACGSQRQADFGGGGTTKSAVGMNDDSDFCNGSDRHQLGAVASGLAAAAQRRQSSQTITRQSSFWLEDNSVDSVLSLPSTSGVCTGGETAGSQSELCALPCDELACANVELSAIQIGSELGGAGESMDGQQLEASMLMLSGDSIESVRPQSQSQQRQQQQSDPIVTSAIGAAFSTATTKTSATATPAAATGAPMSRAPNPLSRGRLSSSSSTNTSSPSPDFSRSSERILAATKSTSSISKRRLFGKLRSRRSHFHHHHRRGVNLSNDSATGAATSSGSFGKLPGVPSCSSTGSSGGGGGGGGGGGAGSVRKHMRGSIAGGNSKGQSSTNINKDDSSDYSDNDDAMNDLQARLEEQDDELAGIDRDFMNVTNVRPISERNSASLERQCRDLWKLRAVLHEDSCDNWSNYHQRLNRRYDSGYKSIENQLSSSIEGASVGSLNRLGSMTTQVGACGAPVAGQQQAPTSTSSETEPKQSSSSSLTTLETVDRPSSTTDKQPAYERLVSPASPASAIIDPIDSKLADLDLEDHSALLLACEPVGERECNSRSSKASSNESVQGEEKD